MFPLFYRLPRTALKVFSGWNLLGHALAIVLTVIIVKSGLDWKYYSATRDGALTRLALPGIRLGFILPIYGTLLLLLFGLIFRARRVIMTAWALGQAALLGYLVASAYKAFTGRRPPPLPWRVKASGPGVPMIDSSHGFQLGFWRGGIFWGWPSSHTTVAFSMSLCLVALWPRNKVLVALALLYALYIGLSVSVTIHWLSEFVAGAIFGSIIGLAVGNSFKNHSGYAEAPQPK